MDDLTIPFLGERRSGWQYPFGSLVAAGAPLCAGSDWPVSSPNPLWGMHVAVNRSLPASAGGTGADPFLPGQAISLPVALAAYTSGSARVNGRDDEAGAIRPGPGRRLRRGRRRPGAPSRGRDLPGLGPADLGPRRSRLPAVSPPAEHGSRE